MPRRVEVRAKPNARVTKVEETEPGHYDVWVAAPPREGRANEAIRDALAEHFGVAPSRVQLLRGQGGKRKVFEIDDGTPVSASKKPRKG